MIKILYNEKVIDVVRYPKFIRFLPYGHIAITDKTSAQGIIGSDDATIYSFVANNYKFVTIADITLDEFERLQSLLNSGQEISADESALSKAKLNKIKLLSSICRNKIISGFSVELSDGNKYDFKLTVEDQLNLMSLENQLNNGETFFIYHATNQPCKIYNKEDMLKIISTFRSFTLYHTTYFNIAKQYINKLTSIDQVNLFNYGMDVSNMTSDVIIKQILKTGGSF